MPALARLIAQKLLSFIHQRKLMFAKFYFCDSKKFLILIFCLQRSKGFHSAEMFFDDLDCRDLGDADKPLQYSL